MFERLLYGLMGLSSDLIQQDAKGRFRLSPQYDGVEDQQLIDEILSLGTSYHFLSEFVADIQQRNPILLGTSLYITALAVSLKGVLFEYRECLTKCEDYILRTPFATVSDLRSDLNDWFLILPALESRIFKIHNEKMHGCHLLKYIYGEMRSCGQEVVRSKFAILFNSINTVFFDQLTSWLMYGILKDPHCEFFIRPNQDGVEVVDDFVPPYLADAAVTVKQIGTIVAKFNRENGFDIIYGEEECHYIQAIEECRSNLDDLGNVIASLNSFTSRYLWESLVIKQRFEYHLEAIYNTIFMGRGDIFLQWMDKVQKHFAMPFEERHLTIASETLKSCFYDAYPDKDADFIERIRFINKSEGTDTWSLIVLTYELPPELDCLLSPKEIRSLGYTFQILLAVKRAELAMNSTLGLKLSQQARRLRYEMGFFLLNFESYLHMDVLHVCFNNLRNVLHDSKDFDALKKALALFVQDVTCMTFVTLARFKETLLKVFQTCLRFPLYINADLKGIEHEFRAQQDILRKCFHVLQDHGQGQQEKRNECIMKFLYRLDYNQQHQAAERQEKVLREKLRNSYVPVEGPS